MKKLSGFTIVELMATIAIAGVLIAAAVPSMKEFVQKGKMTSFTNELVSAIQIARSEAIKQSGVACVCSTSDATIPVPVCDGGDNWETGWIAFSDSTGDCSYNPADVVPDVLLRVMDNKGFERFTLRNNNASINSTDYIRFNGRGIPQKSNGASQQGMFTACDQRGLILADNGDTVPSGVVLSPAGSVRTTKDATQVIACP